MSIATGRVSLNNLTQGRCAPRSSKKKAKLAKRAAKLLARRENDSLQRPASAVAACTLEDSPAQEVIPAMSVTSTRDLASSTDNRESSVGVCDLPAAGDHAGALQPHILAYCSHMSSSTVEMIRNTAEGNGDGTDMDGSAMYDGAAAAEAEGEAGWHVVDSCPPLEEEEEVEDEDVEEEGFLVVPSSS